MKIYVKIFDKDAIATDIEDINENTLVFIGDIDSEDFESIHSYNLKYIIGNLKLKYGKKYNLEYLEKCIGIIYLAGFENYESTRLNFLDNTLIIDLTHNKLLKSNIGELSEITKNDSKVVLEAVKQEGYPDHFEYEYTSNESSEDNNQPFVLEAVNNIKNQKKK